MCCTDPGRLLTEHFSSLLRRPCPRTRWRGCRCSTSPLCATTSSAWKRTTGASPPRSRSTWPTTAPTSDPVSGTTRLFEATPARAHRYVKLKDLGDERLNYSRGGLGPRCHPHGDQSEGRECRSPGSSVRFCFGKMLESHMEVEKELKSEREREREGQEGGVA